MISWKEIAGNILSQVLAPLSITGDPLDTPAVDIHTGVESLPIDKVTLRDELRRDEGCIPYAYTDSLGYWTIGVGRLIDRRKGGRLSDQEIDYLLDNDIDSHLGDIRQEDWFQAADTDGRRRALVNMCFQLGKDGLTKFSGFLQLVRQKKWKEAADDLRKNTLW